MIIGLDVGGTHTDVVLLGVQGLVREAKVPTDHDNLFQTVLTGLDRVMEGVKPKEISRIVLSTTLTTNAIVQNRIPDLGMIVTGGPGIDPELFRTNAQYHIVRGAMDHRGREIEPLDPAEIKETASRIKNAGIRHVGVVGKFSPRNPDHELKIRDLIQKHFKKVFLGHWISGNLNFPRRIATTFLNAAVYPIHKNFFTAVTKSLRQKGLDLPIHILKADGGTMNFDASIHYPGQTIFSGPAASVMGAIAFATDDQDTIVLDVGGTTTDIGVLVNRSPVLDPLGIEIGDHKTLIRALKTVSIGVGGDSRIHVTGDGLTIGPERMGPAMAYGGPEPTPTDALFVLGMVADGNPERARQGVASIAERIGQSLEETARRIFDQACRQIIEQIRRLIESINSKPVYTVKELQEGYKVTPRQIMILGGPAAHVAANLEKLGDYRVRVVPRWGVANAIGAGLARTTSEVILYADTEQGIASAPVEKFRKDINRNYTIRDAEADAIRILREKALQRGATQDDLETEIIESMQFNMVRGFRTIGRNIRIRAQVKPGLIRGYEKVTQGL